MKTQATYPKSKKFLYRDYKRFDGKTFVLELESKILTQSGTSLNENYLSYQFADIVNKHALLKAKVLGGNNVLTNIWEKRCAEELHSESRLTKTKQF